MGATETLLQVEGLTKSYDGSSKALEGVSFSMNRGEFVSLIGSSGAGKSTLLRCINRLIDPTCGSVVFDGRETSSARGRALREIRRRMAMVFQGYNLVYRSTAIENVLQGRLGYKNSLMGALSIFTEEEKRAAFDALDRVGLGCCAYMRADQLSGGQKQRVGIARALANDPKVLLSDEATSALDPETTVATLELLKRINQELGVTIVMITHEMNVVKQICGRVVVMNKGQIVEEGDVIDIFARPQSETTRALIGQVMARDLPQSIVDTVNASRALNGRDNVHLLHLSFIGGEVTEPVISLASREFGINFNILRGTVDDLQGRTLGTLTLLVVAPGETYRKAVEFIRDRGVLVEEIQNV